MIVKDEELLLIDQKIFDSHKQIEHLRIIEKSDKTGFYSKQISKLEKILRNRKLGSI